MSHTPVDNDLEATIRRIIREETGLTPVAPAEKWRGGQLVLRPGKPGVQEKAMPIDSFFNKIVMLRNRLRTLEQQYWPVAGLDLALLTTASLAAFTARQLSRREQEQRAAGALADQEELPASHNSEAPVHG